MSTRFRVQVIMSTRFRVQDTKFKSKVIRVQSSSHQRSEFRCFEFIYQVIKVQSLFYQCSHHQSFLHQCSNHQSSKLLLSEVKKLDTRIFKVLGVDRWGHEISKIVISILRSGHHRSDFPPPGVNNFASGLRNQVMRLHEQVVFTKVRSLGFYHQVIRGQVSSACVLVTYKKEISFCFSFLLCGWLSIFIWPEILGRDKFNGTKTQRKWWIRLPKGQEAERKP